MAALFAIVMTCLTLAAIPWGIAQIAITDQPKLQASRRHRRNFRRVTAAAAIALTAVAMVTGPWPYVAAIAAAVWLDAHWRRYAKTPHGAANLAAAKAEREVSR